MSLKTYLLEEICFKTQIFNNKELNQLKKEVSELKRQQRRILRAFDNRFCFGCQEKVRKTQQCTKCNRTFCENCDRGIFLYVVGFFCNATRLCFDCETKVHIKNKS